MTFRCALLVLIAGLFNHSVAAAQLTWEAKHLQAHPKFTDTKATFEFRFVNEGTAPATIESVKPECGCTAAATEKQTYAPGEKGQLTVTFSFGPRVGRQQKQIAVKLAGEEKPIILTLVAFIPEPLRMNPQFVFWKSDETPVAKPIEVIAPEGTQVFIEKVASSDPTFAAQLETVEPGRRYKLLVTPQGPATPRVTVLTIESKIGSEQKTYRAYAKVQAPH